MNCQKPNCKAKALKNDEYCYFHSETTKDQRAKSSKKGGSRKRTNIADIEIDSVADLKQILADAINDLRRSKVGVVGRTRAIGYLAGVMIEAIDKSDIEARIDALERKFEAESIT